MRETVLSTISFAEVNYVTHVLIVCPLALTTSGITSQETCINCEDCVVGAALCALLLLGPASQFVHARGGTWQGFVYQGPAGSRPYFVYTPVNYHPGTPVPLFVMLHGCTQTAADFAAGTQMDELADAHQFIVLYPQQTIFNNPAACWTAYVRPAERERETRPGRDGSGAAHAAHTYGRRFVGLKAVASRPRIPAVAEPSFAGCAPRLDRAVLSRAAKLFAPPAAIAPTPVSPGTCTGCRSQVIAYPQPSDPLAPTSPSMLSPRRRPCRFRAGRR